MYDMTRVAGNGYFDADNNKDARKNAQTPRGYHKRSLNSNGGWTIQTNGSLANTRILTYANEIDILSGFRKMRPHEKLPNITVYELYDTIKLTS